jgi:hypothetical protein
MEEWALMVGDCEKRESRLTEWERSFVQSIGETLAKGYTLTTKQDETLGEIWERATARG